MKIFFNKLFVLLITTILLVGCEDMQVEKLAPNAPLTRTVIVYMVANNDLYKNAIENIKQMESAWKSSYGNLIVYLSPINGNPYLLKITKGDGKSVVSPIVKQYSKQNSCDPIVMKAVINDIINLYPADSYGAILWSHSTAWLPTNNLSLYKQSKTYSTDDPSVPRLKSFGDDNGKKMEIEELTKGLPLKFDFIIFDACLMANIESLYELRNKAQYVIASSTEVLEMGYPYDKIMDDLFTTEPNLEKIADAYFNSYDVLNGISRSATVSIIKMDEIDKLAEVTNHLIVSNYPKNDLQSLNLSSIQQLDTWLKNIFYDFGDFIQQAYPTADLTEFNEQLDRVIVYKKNTPQFYNKFYIKKHCGLNCFIPHSASTSLDNAFAETSWAKASGLALLAK